MDPQDPLPNEVPTPAQAEGSSDSPIAVTRNTKTDSAGRRIEHPMQAILGAVIVLLLGFALTQTNDRISRLEDRFSRLEDRVDTGFAKIDQRFTAQDAKIDQRFTAQDARIDQKFTAQDAKIEQRFAQQDARLDEINLKLTALIAALNATAEVEAALEGKLLDPNAAPADEPTN